MMLSEEPFLVGTHLKVYSFLRTNEGSWFTVDEIATSLGFKQSTVNSALTFVRKLPRIYEKTGPSGRRMFGFVRWLVK
jgi:predicted transcriptional regulator